MQTRSAANGPYGPNNPPPPLPGFPPNGSRRDIADEEVRGLRRGRNRPPPAKRRRTYAAAEAKDAYARNPERFRSRSPALPQDRQPDRHYRERSPLRDEKAKAWSPPRSHGRQTAFHKDDGVRCYACNKNGHKAIDCKGAVGGISSYAARACFRCGELDHIARECTIRVGQIKTNTEVAASNERFHQSTHVGYRRSWSPPPNLKAVDAWKKGVRGDRWVPTQEAWDDHGCNETPGNSRRAFRSLYDAGASNHMFDWYRDARGNTGQDRNSAALSSARAIEDKVDWDDDALDAGDAANGKTNKTNKTLREVQRASHSNGSKHSQGPRLYSPDSHQGRQHMIKENTPRKQMIPARDGQDRPQQPRPKTTKKDPRLSQEDDVNAPPTAYDLCGYDYHVKKKYDELPKSQRFVNGGNGKVAPAKYGSEQRHDLGLCFTTFLTKYCCEMGLHCPWRHHPLSAAERAWIVEHGKHRGKEFLDNVDRWWAFPEMPVPAATMQGLGND